MNACAAKFQEHWKALEISSPVTLLLSGGGDSVALFHLLKEIGQKFRVLHFVHDSASDFPQKSLDFCRDLCASQGVEFESLSIEGRALTQKGDLSWEAACRKLRYDGLAGRPGCFLTAHTQDDQAETVLMRLLNGAGLSGLAGIRQVRGDGVVRPLLGMTRNELRTYLQDRGCRWLEDPTNVDGNERAIFRSQIIPPLRQHKPHLDSTLARTAGRLAQDEDYLNRQTLDWISAHTQPGGDSWSLADVQSLPPALLSRFVRRLWSAVGDSARRPRGSLFEECFRLIKGGRNEAEVPFPNGSKLLILGQKLWVCPALPQADWSYDLSELTEFETDFLRISKEPFEGAQGWPGGSVLRSRRPGDRFQQKNVKKVLASTGQPPWVRDRCPILLRGQEVVHVWRPDHPFQVEGSAGIWVRFLPQALRVNLLQ